MHAYPLKCSKDKVVPNVSEKHMARNNNSKTGKHFYQKSKTGEHFYQSNANHYCGMQVNDPTKDSEGVEREENKVSNHAYHK